MFARANSWRMLASSARTPVHLRKLLKKLAQNFLALAQLQAPHADDNFLGRANAKL